MDLTFPRDAFENQDCKILGHWMEQVAASAKSRDFSDVRPVAEKLLRREDSRAVGVMMSAFESWCL